MPKITHEALVMILRNAPTLLVDLLWPERQISARSIHIAHDDFVDVNLAEYRADDVVLIGEDPEAPAAALVREAQMTIQAMKRRTWPLYVAGLYARHGCPVDIVVLTLDREVAAWAGRPITVGLLRGAMTITPTVIGPDQIPRITDPEVARRSPELAVLSALAHGSEPEGESIAMAALAGMPMLDNMREMFYVDLVLHHLGPAARAILEKLMSTTNYQFQSEFAQKYFFEGKHEGKEEGELKGEAKMLLRIIDRRGVAISSHDRERVMSCADASQIEAWADRALTATTRDEIFES
jgi:hypothetical protein